MKENVVGIEISVNDWLGQGMEIIHTLRDIQSYVKLKFVTYLLSLHDVPLLPFA